VGTFARSALIISLAAALLGGCGALPLSSSKGQGDVQLPIGAPGAMPQGRAIATSADRGGSWMLPEAKNQDLVYVANWYPTNTVTVYSYASQKLVGTLTGFAYPSGLCTDKAGNVFVVNEDGNQGGRNILEYRHGGTKAIKHLPDADGAVACSIDSTTGNLAVANAGYYGSCSGSLYVYKNARGTPAKYTDGYDICAFFSSVYDDKGNLFVGGDNDAYYPQFGFAELPKGGGALANISLSRQLANSDGSLGWDGSHVTLSSSGYNNRIYRLTIKGRRAYSRQFTSLAGGVPVDEYWFQSSRRRQILIGADNGPDNDVLYWNYPAGGLPIVVIKDGVNHPDGVTVSVAAKP
jgi:hypothetical protein